MTAVDFNVFTGMELCFFNDACTRVATRLNTKLHSTYIHNLSYQFSDCIRFDPNNQTISTVKARDVVDR